MNRLDINQLHQANKLLEGAETNMGGCLAGARPGEKMLAGLGVLYWRGEEIAFEWVPIVPCNPPPSWRGSPRARPRFRCPECERGCYHLYLMAGERFACRICAGVRCPSVADQSHFAGLMRRMNKARLKAGVTDPSVLADPPPAKGGPRSRWLRRRRMIALRLAELAALGISLEDFLRLAEPPAAEPEAQG